MVTEASFSSADNATASIYRNPSNSAGCSIEQILSPISIVKSNNGPTPGFMSPSTGGDESGPFSGAVGPTINELNPYFTRIFGDDGSNFITYTDYNVVVHYPTNDLNLKKNTLRPQITEVRTQAFRGPMILSGWGFDIADLPVPSAQGNRRSFDVNLINNRSYWKTGPVHLMWDDERQVWTGGYQMVCGVLKSPITAATVSGPSTFSVKLLRPTSTGHGTLDTNIGETITCVNRSKDFTFTPIQADINDEKIFVICARLNYEWVLVALHKDSSNVYIGEYEGRWLKDTTSFVTQQHPSTDPDIIQVEVNNLFGDFGEEGQTGICSYAKLGDEYYLLSAELQEGSNIYIGTFNSKWTKGTSTLVSQTKPTTETTVSVNVINLFADVGRTGSSTSCAYAKVGNEYYLLAAECAL